MRSVGQAVDAFVQRAAQSTAHARAFSVERTAEPLPSAFRMRIPTKSSQRIDLVSPSDSRTRLIFGGLAGKFGALGAVDETV